MTAPATEAVRRPDRTGPRGPAVAGAVRPGFEAVRQAFVENFERRGELGAACCVELRGEKVVDLWGGVRNVATGEPWEEGTMALVHSTTKGLAALAVALAHSRGLLDYDERVCAYWPEFAQQGKDRITVRQLLSHQAGLFALDERPVRSLVADPERLAAVLARQRPAWPPGMRQAYHAITLGFYEGELLRRIDPRHRTLGRFFREEIAEPLGAEVHLRLPRDVPASRLAPLHRPPMTAMLLTMPPRFLLAALNPRSRLRRALLGSELAEEGQGDAVYARELEVPSGLGIATARGIARVYGEFATGGRTLGLREATLRQLMAPPVAPARGFRDACLKVEVRFSLGFMKPGPENPFAHATAFGNPGSGGSMGLADPRYELGYAYVPNQMGTHLQDPRDAALRRAAYRAIGVAVPYRE